MIRVLVVDDSPLFRKVLSDLLSADSEIGEVMTAGNGEIALSKVKQSMPDVITMDVEMPGIGGIETIARIMSIHPIPIIIVSAFSGDRVALSLRAMELGVIDIIEKPGGPQSGRIGPIAEHLLETVKSAANVKMVPRNYAQPADRAETPTVNESSRLSGERFHLVAIGGSAGAPLALKALLIGLPGDFPVGIVAALHMPPPFTALYAERLNSLCAVHVREAKDGEKVIAGNVLIAPGDVHLMVRRSGKDAVAVLASSVKVNNHRPSLDVLMRSVSDAFGDRAIAVIMSGMGRDGAAGMTQLKRRGGYVIAQDETSSVVFGMNRVVIENGDADEVLSPGSIAERLIRLTKRNNSVRGRI